MIESQQECLNEREECLNEREVHLAYYGDHYDVVSPIRDPYESQLGKRAGPEALVDDNGIVVGCLNRAINDVTKPPPSTVTSIPGVGRRGGSKRGRTFMDPEEQAAFNADLEPLLTSSLQCGVVSLSVRESDARDCATALSKWKDGSFKVYDTTGRKVLLDLGGFNTYPKTLQAHEMGCLFTGAVTLSSRAAPRPCRVNNDVGAVAVRRSLAFSQPPSGIGACFSCYGWRFKRMAWSSDERILVSHHLHAFPSSGGNRDGLGIGDASIS